ncbi:type VII toxin-antitoxin system HepT family RNase toxin [Alkalibacillus aidingensis]|uniref:type VII toxin-antitoxin system HepT family RNase toxin n=1 Tax=Alkalibacillus aidingensis TaxID=2747607 RepID=UPI0016608D0C|nr:DUF86 domain-containing protein [Alkalibacillus aidingensis]
MYFVEQEKIDQTLSYMDQLLKTYKEEHFSSTKVHQLALERIAQMTIESIIDVGNMMIDGFIMRDPGSYEDIIDILVDEKVIDAEEEGSFKAIIGLRTMLVRDYSEINHQLILDQLNQHLETLENFSHQVLTYLEKEMGPITAFKKRADE